MMFYVWGYDPTHKIKPELYFSSEDPIKAQRAMFEMKWECTRYAEVRVVDREKNVCALEDMLHFKGPMRPDK